MNQEKPCGYERFNRLERIHCSIYSKH